MKILTTKQIKESPLSSLLFQSEEAKRFVKAKYQTGAFEVLPGLSPESSKFRKAMAQISERYGELSEQSPLNDSYYSGLKCPALDGKLFTVAGLGPKNIGYCPIGEYQRGSFRCDEHAEIFEILFKKMFLRGRPTGLRVNSKSSSGLPNLTYDRDKKIAAFREALSDISHIFRAVRNKDGRYLLEKDIAPIYTAGKRIQPEKEGKTRFYYSYENGEMIKLKTDQSSAYDGFRTGRGRRVYGMKNSNNLIAGCFLIPCEKFYLSEYAYSFKHRFPEEICQDLNDYMAEYPNTWIRGVDVVTFDQTVKDWMKDKFCDLICKYHSIELGEFVRANLFGQVFFNNGGIDLEGLLIGDVLSVEKVTGAGLLSGTIFVSSLGKFLNTFDTLSRLWDIGLITNIEQDTESYLKGKFKVRTKNCGDDAILMFPDEKVGLAFFKTEGYFEIEIEEGLLFLGNIYFIEDGLWRSLPNMASKLYNLFVPEKGWMSKLRRDFFWIGLKEHSIHGGKHPMYNEVMGIVDDAFMNSYGFKFTDYMNRLIEAGEIRGTLNDLDMQFLADPDIIHYKVDADDISPEVLALEMDTIKFDEFEEFVSKYTNLEIFKEVA